MTTEQERHAEAEDYAHPVCVVHLAWIPCRHGRDDSPCEWRYDEASQNIVGQFHGGKFSRWELIKELEGS